MLCCSVCICGFSWEPSLAITALAMTGRDTPHARPSATGKDTGEWVHNTVQLRNSPALDGTNTYGTFC